MPDIRSENEAKEVWQEYDKRYKEIVAEDGAARSFATKKMYADISDEEKRALDTKLSALNRKQREAFKKLQRIWRLGTKKETKVLLDVKKSYPAEVLQFFSLESGELRKTIGNYITKLYTEYEKPLSKNLNYLIDEFIKNCNRELLLREDPQNILKKYLESYTTSIDTNKTLTKSEELSDLEAKTYQKLNDLLRSLNDNKIKELAHALVNGNWESDIFKDDGLAFYAMSLYIRGKISRQQITSILYRRGVENDFAIQNTYPILDETGQFTAEAKNKLIPLIQNREFLPKLSKDQIESFRLLVQQLPRSEQFFYFSDKEPKTDGGKILNLADLDSLYYTKKSFLHMPIGALDALGIVRFGMDNYTLPIARLGQMGVRHIEAGVRQGSRPTAISYPKPKIYDDIHGFPVYDFVATIHDASFHALCMSVMPPFFKKTLLRFVDITRSAVATSFKKAPEEIWSKEIWNWIDAEFNFFLLKAKSQRYTTNNAKTTALCDAFESQRALYERYKVDGTAQLGSSILIQYGKLTAVGTIILLDFIEREEDWRSNIGIEPKYLTGKYKEYYNGIASIYNDLKGCDLKIKLLKISLYLCLQKNNALHLWDEINNAIQNNKKLYKKLIFAKFKMEDPQHPNSLYLRFTDKAAENRLLDEGNALLYFVFFTERSKIERKYRKIYLKARTQEHFSVDEAKLVVHLRKEDLSEKEALYRVKPTSTKWIKLHSIQTMLLCLSVVGAIFILPFVIIANVAKAKLEAKKQLEQFKTKRKSTEAGPKATKSHNVRTKTSRHKTRRTKGQTIFQPPNKVEREHTPDSQTPKPKPN